MFSRSPFRPPIQPSWAIVSLAALATSGVVVAAVACEAEAYGQVSRLDELIEKRVVPRLRPRQ